MQTLDKIFKNCSYQLASCYLEQANQLHHQLSLGITFNALGGKRIRQNTNIVRFKIGRKWRFLYLIKDRRLIPWCLISRQDFEKTLKRRYK